MKSTHGFTLIELM
ncbi:MAG: prepilin-type N-terminal cleavage/methylation domain-containing protein, partial [Methylococcus sp.]